MNRQRLQGFTLLEVLIALAVLALAMGAVIKATSDYTSNQSYLRDRTLAMWVARNVLVEYQVKGEWLSVGERKGTRDMGNQEWRWLARISQTEEAELRRLDVEVYPVDSDDDENPVSVLSGFLRQPEG
ncbi:MAG: type II secretion system minor pseudopilin GspI [Gammaproteobacteria bacterium]|nr:type II secretion system minor pseudopilin GspI [Gammaproteobacteria bacterium]MDH3986495.1 type II secretion system minor pseudopilin GspI [Gammaproteobacteria bacterium]